MEGEEDTAAFNKFAFEFKKPAGEGIADIEDLRIQLISLFSDAPYNQQVISGINWDLKKVMDELNNNSLGLFGPNKKYSSLQDFLQNPDTIELID